MFKEFKEFIQRGNVIDMAVGIVIGAAFGGIVNSFVKDILMPPIGKILGGIDFSNFFIPLSSGNYPTLADAQKAGIPTINYGIFLNTIINFLIISFAIFLMIKQINKLKRKEEKAPAEPTTKNCPFCATDIPIKAKKCPNCTSDLEKAGN